VLGINPTKEELQDLTIQIDPNVSGFLKLPDLLDMMSRIIMERNYDAQIEDAFRCFDKNGIGTIARQELHSIFEVRFSIAGFFIALICRILENILKRKRSRVS